MTSGGEVEQMHNDLRAWANGMHTTEAAVELLIRGFNGRFAAAGNPWIVNNENGGYWVDFQSLPEHTGVLSSGERAYLHIAASIGLGGNDGPTVNLSDAIASLGRDQLDLVLAGLAHANGSHAHSDIAVDHITGTAAVITLDSLYPWPGLWMAAPRSPEQMRE